MTIALEAQRLEVTEKIIAAFENFRPHYHLGGIIQQLFAALWRGWAARISVLFAVAVGAMGIFDMPDIGRQRRSALLGVLVQLLLGFFSLGLNVPIYAKI